MMSLTRSYEFQVYIKPIAAARPRVTKQGWSYYPKAYTQFQKTFGLALDKLDLGKEWPKDALVVCLCESVLPAFKTSKRLDPMGDVDNFAKAVTDAITKSQRFWADDRQMMSLTTTKRFCIGDEPPHINVTISEIQNE